MPDSIQLAYVGDTANLQLFAKTRQRRPVSLIGQPKSTRRALATT